MMSRRIKALAALVATVALTAVGIGCEGHVLGYDSAVLEMRLDPDTARLDAWGRAIQLQLSAQDQQGNPVVPKLVGWRSMDTSVVRVEADGTVRAIGDGIAEVVAIVGASSASATVEVDATVWNRAWVSSGGGEMANSATVRDSTAITVLDRTAIRSGHR